MVNAPTRVLRPGHICARPEDYPYKARDTEVIIKREKNALGDEYAWSKKVCFNAIKWDYLHETEVDRYRMPVD